MTNVKNLKKHRVKTADKRLTLSFLLLTFVLRMRRNGYLWTSGVNLDTAVRFADPDFLLECKISAIWRRFPLILAFYMPNVRHISASGFLTYWPKKYTTCVDPNVDNSHQVWSWYDHPLPSYSVFVCWHVTWPWTDVIHGESYDQPCHQVLRPYAYPFLSYEL